MPSRSKRPKGLFSEQALFDSGIFDTTVKFACDSHFIDAARRHPVGAAGRSTDFARRALHVAWMRGTMAANEERELADAIPDYEHVASLATNASKGLDALLQNLSRRKIGKLGATALVPPLRQMEVHSPASATESRHQIASEQAQTLLDAAAVVQRFAAYAAARRDQLAGGRKNSGRSDKAAFLHVLAEAWVFLTGKLPGQGIDRNPFLRLVEASWSDCSGGEEEPFASQLRSVLGQMRTDPVYRQQDYRPSWL